jgi:hypothetical protein
VLRFQVLIVAFFVGGEVRAAEAPGPLRFRPTNPRYFTDGTKSADGSLRAVYLTGSHTWTNLQDRGWIGGPVSDVLDSSRYLDLLERHHHNFIRLWTWEGWSSGRRPQPAYFEPLPYVRTGPGTALDGQPRFDPTMFNPAYFDRVRAAFSLHLRVMPFYTSGRQAPVEPKIEE